MHVFQVTCTCHNQPSDYHWLLLQQPHGSFVFCMCVCVAATLIAFQPYGADSAKPAGCYRRDFKRAPPGSNRYPNPLSQFLAKLLCKPTMYSKHHLHAVSRLTPDSANEALPPNMQCIVACPCVYMSMWNHWWNQPVCSNLIVLDFSGVQTPGVLDDLFFYEGALGAHLGPQGVNISLWAPTAQQVCCLLYTHILNGYTCI